MRPTEQIEQRIKEFKVMPGDRMRQQMLADILETQAKTKIINPSVSTAGAWSIIMKSKITKFAAAAAILIAVGLGFLLLDHANTTAYAFEQTIQANRDLRFIHIRASTLAHKEPIELWAEFNAYGSVHNLRGEIPAWIDNHGEDGAKSFVWKNDKAQVWIPKKKISITIRNKSVAAQMLLLFNGLDPKLAIGELNEKASKGKAKIDIIEPSSLSEPITVTATSLPNEFLNDDWLKKAAHANESEGPSSAAVFANPDMLCHRIMLYIDQTTKLVTSIEFFRLKDGNYQKTATIEYRDYNQPITAGVFTLNIPVDSIVVDQTSQEVGLLQGARTEKEIAIEVVRQFMEAMIARDYAKVSPLYEGIPAEKLEKEFFPKLKIVKIVSIGEPVPSSLTGGYRVPCVLEIEWNGKIRQWSPTGPFVRKVQGQPERWTICGGI